MMKYHYENYSTDISPERAKINGIVRKAELRQAQERWERRLNPSPLDRILRFFFPRKSYF